MPSLPLSLNHPSVDGGVPDLDLWKPPTEVGVRGVGVGVTLRAGSCTCMRSNVSARCADLAARATALNCCIHRQWRFQRVFLYRHRHTQPPCVRNVSGSVKKIPPAQAAMPSDALGK